MGQLASVRPAWCDRILGWRGRVGLIIPATNLLLETALPAMAPEGLTFHTARIALSAAADVEAVRRMSEKKWAAVSDLVSARVDLIVYACTASSFVEGPQYDIDMIERIKRETGLPCVTTMQSIDAAMRVLGIRNPVLISPYTEQFEHIETQYLQNAGFGIAASTSMGIADPVALHDPLPGDIYRLARKAFTDAADGFLISCNALRGHLVADVLERDCARPVVTSLTATLWGILKALHIGTPVPGFGRLLDMPELRTAAVTQPAPLPR